MLVAAPSRVNFLSLVFSHILQKRRGRREEEVSGDGAAEVEQAIVVARRAADKHIFKHLLESAGRTRFAVPPANEL